MNSKWELNSKPNVWLSVTTSYLAESLSPLLRPLRKCWPRALPENCCLSYTFLRQGRNCCQEKTIKLFYQLPQGCCLWLIFFFLGNFPNSSSAIRLCLEKVYANWQINTSLSLSLSPLCEHAHTRTHMYTGTHAPEIRL